MDDNIKKALLDIVGEENLTDRLIDMVSYSYDSSEHSHRPECAVWATTTEQVSQILKLANAHRIAVIPRGAGTGLSGMAVPVKGGIVLDLNRMNKIRTISIEDRYAVVQPGVVYADLDKALAPSGFCFPPDPGSGTVCTLGGNVATNAGGVKGAKYGTTRDYVLGLEVVMADGRVMRTGMRNGRWSLVTYAHSSSFSGPIRRRRWTRSSWRRRISRRRRQGGRRSCARAMRFGRVLPRACCGSTTLRISMPCARSSSRGFRG